MTDQPAQYDANLVRAWLRILHGDAPGLVNVVSTDHWAGQSFPTDQLDQAAAYVAHLDAQGREGIYVRVTTLAHPLEEGRRGGNADTLALPALWADLDIDGPGHEHKLCEPDCPKGHKHITMPLPPDVESGQKVITMSGLPEPTIWVHSGGGLYPIWLLDQPHIVTEQDLADVKDLAAGWQLIVEHAAAQLGWHYGRGVGDLARVLRIPGTINRKAGLTRPARILSGTTTRYPIGDLYAALHAGLAAIRPPEPTPPAPGPASSAPSTPAAGTRSNIPGMPPGEAFAAATSWADILTPHGWTLSHTEGDIEYWTRPGKRSGVSATVNALGTDRFHCFTTSSDFEAGESYSKMGVYAVLNHAGDHSAAARALRQAGYGDPLPDPAAEQRENLRIILGPPADAIVAQAVEEAVAAQDARFQSGKVDVTNPAEAEKWLRAGIGRGRLAGFFYRGTEIVYTPREGEDGYQHLRHLDVGDEDGPAQVRPVNDSILAARVTVTHDVYRLVKQGEDYVPTAALFPRSAAKVVVDAPDAAPNLRVLRGVVHSPVMRPDGTVLAEPGYDAATGLLYLPGADLDVPPVPEALTQADIAAARNLLDEMTAGFRWVSEHDRANYYGTLLTPLLRAMIPPPYKLVAIGAPQPGSGKTLLADIARALHGGVFRSEMPEDDAELRKQVSSILDYTTGPVVTFDNVTGILRSSTLAGLLTSASWDDRRLGGNEMLNARNDRLWLITGNNLTLGGDLIRRTLWITIDPGVPNPHLRTDFAISDLHQWVRQRRGQLIHALLTLVRAWVHAGRPTDRNGSDSYAQWGAAIRGILHVAGVPGRFDDSTTARQRDGADDDEWAEFLTAVHQVMGDRIWTVKEVLGHFNTSLLVDNGAIPLDVLPADLAHKAHGPGGIASIGKSLGRWLANRDGRWAGGFAVRSQGENRGGKLWRIQTTENDHA